MITQHIKITEILADDGFNCRGDIKATSQDMIELARDIEKNGLLQPIIVMPCAVGDFKWKLLAGFRRYTAHLVLKKDEIPAVIRDVMDEADAIALNLNENLKRKDLNVMQEAWALRKFLELGFTEQQIMDKIGATRGWTQVRVLALKLPPEIQKEIEAGLITQTHIRELYEMRGSPDLQFEAVRKIKMARERGDRSVSITDKKKQKEDQEAAKQGRPSKGELNAFISHLVEQLGSSPLTRGLAYAAGNITFKELELEIREAALHAGKTYVPFGTPAPTPA